MILHILNIFRLWWLCIFSVINGQLTLNNKKKSYWPQPLISEVFCVLLSSYLALMNALGSEIIQHLQRSVKTLLTSVNPFTAASGSSQRETITRHSNQQCQTLSRWSLLSLSLPFCSVLTLLNFLLGKTADVKLVSGTR